MSFIQFDDEAFLGRIEKIVERIVAKHNVLQDKWIDGEEAMKKLGIKSTTTLQKYRDEGRIRFSQADKRVIMYDRFSIEEYLENNAKDTF